MHSPMQCLQKAGLVGDWQITPIVNGLSHQHFHLISEHEQLVLRMYRPQSLPWLDARHELHVLSAAANQGLAPELVYQSPDCDFFISRYMAHQPVQTLSLDSLTSLLSGVAKLPIHRCMTLSERYQGYVKQGLQHSPQKISAPQVQKIRQQAEHAIEQLESIHWPPAPAFLDWHEHNLLAAPDKLYLIDYEYACLTALPLELASLVESGLVKADDWPALHGFMQQLHGQHVSEKQLKLARIVYLSFCYLWYLAHQVDEPEEMELLLTRLQRLN